MDSLGGFMERKLLDISGDKDFIISKEGLLVYFHDPHRQTTHKVYISRKQLIELYGAIPFEELIEQQNKEIATKKEEAKMARKYPMPH